MHRAVSGVHSWLKRHIVFRDSGGAASIGVVTRDEGRPTATLCRAYTSDQDAHAAVARLLSAGVSVAGIQVLMGDAIHDSRDAPAGGFAGAD